MSKIRNFSLDHAVKATAGAGKTTSLLIAVKDQFYRFYQEKGIFPAVLLSTFTVKAAAELKERLIKKALEDQDELFLDFVCSPFLEVGTLHGTFHKVSQNFLEETESSQGFVSFSRRKLISKSVLHSVVTRIGLEEIFSKVGGDQAILDLFEALFERNQISVSTPSFEALHGEVRAGLVELLRASGLEELADLCRRCSSENGEGSILALDEISNELLEVLDSLKDRSAKSKVKKILSFLSASENQNNFLEEYAFLHDKLRELYGEWSKEFRKRLEQESYYSISDVEWRLLELMQGRATKFWDYCFFDEFQDTSPMQKRIIDLITKETPCYFVGDPFQSIYFFRGARSEIFEKDFRSVSDEGGMVEEKVNNYRSSPEVINFVNGLLSHMIEGFPKLIPQKEIQGSVDVFYEPEGDVYSEFSFVLERILAVDLKEESFAVLCRTSRELLLFARFLKEKGINSNLGISKDFQNSLEIIDLCNLLLLLDFPYDNEALLNVLFSPWLGIRDELLKEVIRIKEENGSSLWHALNLVDSVEAQEVVKAISVMRADFSSSSYSQCLWNFVGYSGMLDRTDEIDPTGKREWNLCKFLGVLENQEQKAGFFTRSFVDDLLSGTFPLEKEEVSSETGCILMTVHGSKGLEFDHVAIIGSNKRHSSSRMSYFFDERTEVCGLKIKWPESEKKLRPHYFDPIERHSKTEIAKESRRLFYVAMTRAKRCLMICGSGKVDKNPSEPSWLKQSLIFLDSQEKQYLSNSSKQASSVPGLEPFHIKSSTFLKNRNLFERLKTRESVTGVVSASISESKYESHSDFQTKMKAVSMGINFHEFFEKLDGSNFDQLFSSYESVQDSSLLKDARDYLLEQREFPFNELQALGHREWGFDFYDGANNIAGKVDLWGQLGNQIWVVDYKTGAQIKTDQGFKQLEFYSRVIHRYLGNPSCEFCLALVYPLRRKTLVERRVF